VSELLRVPTGSEERCAQHRSAHPVNEAGAEESIKKAADFVRDNLASLLPNPPQVMSGQAVACA
jgi:hypothetical protein